MSNGVVDHEAHRLYQLLLREHLAKYYGECLGLTEAQVSAAIEKRLRRERGTALAELLDEVVGLAGKRILDVGSGWGELLLACAMRGAEVRGIEPDASELRISEMLFKSYGLGHVASRGVGERIPYDDGSFDFVTCQQVLEHVDDVGQVVAELVRVTRPGGQMFVSTPNYLFPYEGHYRMKWIPLMPKRLGGWWLRMNGRDPAFLLEHVNYTNYLQLRRLWRKHRLVVRNLSAERVKGDVDREGKYGRPIVRILARHFRLYPNISWLLTKPTGHRS